MKNPVPGTPANREIKEKAWLLQKQLKIYMSNWMWAEISQESEDYLENNSYAWSNKSHAVLANYSYHSVQEMPFSSELLIPHFSCS